MFLLILVSFIWALSFGLTKGKLAGLESGFISAARLGLALVVFLPFFRPPRVGWRPGLLLAGIGAIEFGAMYLAYNESFRHLPAHQVALFTLTTPIFVVLIEGCLAREIRPLALAAACLAVLSGLAVSYRDTGWAETWTGFGYVQLSNFCFALGQVLYRRYAPLEGSMAHFAALYCGAFLLTALFAVFTGGMHLPELNPSQLATLLYLGLLASGFCFFWWNRGAKQVTAGTLAVMNNAKVPLAVAASVLVFGESANWGRILCAFVLLALALLCLRVERRPQ